MMSVSNETNFLGQRDVYSTKVEASVSSCSFNAHNVSYTPPSPRLVCIETNPGPSRNKNKNNNNKNRKISVWKPSTQMSDGPAYAGQQIAKLQLTATSLLFATTVTTGVLSFSYGVANTDIINFATRFGNTFDEYRILGVDFRIRQVSVASGVSTIFVDEKSNTAPTLADAQQRTVNLYSNSSASSNTNIVIRWRARDLIDLQYTAIGTTVNVCSLKFYTDAANYGAPIAATPIWLVEPLFYVEFRGIKSQ